MKLFSALTFLYLTMSSGASIAGDRVLEKTSIQPQKTLWVLAVGIDRYQDSYWRDLRYAEKDAQNFIKSLKTKSPYNIVATLLTSQKATSLNIQNAIKNIQSRIKRSDTFIAYFSGHGSLVRGRGAQLKKVLVLHNSQKESLSNSGLLHEKLISQVDGLRSAKKALIFATCHSGVGKSKLPPEIKQLLTSHKGQIPALEQVSEGMVILSAASKSETARESQRLGGDIYTHFLLKGLEIFDRNKDGSVSLLEAHDYSRIKTYQYSQGRQRPSLVVKAIGDADIALSGKKSKPKVAVLEGYDEALAGIVVEINGGEKGELPLAFPLESRQSVVTLYEEGGVEKIASYRVQSHPGEVISIDELARPAPYFFNFGYVTARWKDKKVEKLTSRGFGDTWRLCGGLQTRHFRAGLLYSLRRDGDKEALTNIAFESKYSQSGVQADYIFSMTRQFKGLLGIQATSERYTLRLVDKSNGDAIEKSSSILLPYIRFGMAMERANGEFGLLYSKSASGTFDFDEFGEFKADRQEVSIYFQFAIGGRAEKL